MILKKTLFSVFLLVVACSAAAQSPADSAQFCDPNNWDVVCEQPHLKIKKFRNRTRFQGYRFDLKEAGIFGKLMANIPGVSDSVHLSFLFDTVQSICIVEVDPKGFRVKPAQDQTKHTVSEFVKSTGATAGVNGGFFVVHPTPVDAAVANDFLKINGTVCSPTPTPGWGSGAVAFDDQGYLHFAAWGTAEELQQSVAQWSADYPDAMAAGPMLVLNNQPLVGWQQIDKRTIKRADQSNIFAPRTAIGNRPDGTIVLVVVDGRGYRAYGSSFAELAAMGRWLGLVNMLNLDGGGSSAVVGPTGLLNVPSDGFGFFPVEREVANAVVVLPK